MPNAIGVIIAGMLHSVPLSQRVGVSFHWEATFALILSPVVDVSMVLYLSIYPISVLLFSGVECESFTERANIG